MGSWGAIAALQSEASKPHALSLPQACRGDIYASLAPPPSDAKPRLFEAGLGKHGGVARVLGDQRLQVLGSALDGRPGLTQDGGLLVLVGLQVCVWGGKRGRQCIRSWGGGGNGQSTETLCGTVHSLLQQGRRRAGHLTVTAAAASPPSSSSPPAAPGSLAQLRPHRQRLPRGAPAKDETGAQAHQPPRRGGAKEGRSPLLGCWVGGRQRGQAAGAAACNTVL